LVRNGVDSIVADRLLAHTQLANISAVASTYNIYGFEAERRAALEKWVDFLTSGEGVAISGPSPRLALSPPDPAPLNGTILPPVSDSLAILEAYYGEDGLTSGTVVTRHLPARPEERDQQTERLQRRVIDLLLDSRVAHAIQEIWKATLTEKFKAEHPHAPHAEAIKLMAHCVVRGAINDETVHKPSGIKARRDYWEERIREAENDAKAAQLAAQRAHELRQPEYAEGHEVEAKQFKAEAKLNRQFLKREMAELGDLEVKHRSGDPLHETNQARALALLLNPLIVEIFGGPKPTWAKAFADAAAGGVAARRQRKRRQDSRRVS
jgi:hypothetical protein